MYTLAITGGFATGKSTAARLLLEYHGPAATLFDCDQSVHRWLTKAEIVETLADRFGPTILDAQAAIDRSALGKRIFANTADRDFLEALLHPLVLEEATKAWREAKQADEPVELYIFEVPLLYEVNFGVPHDLDVLIAASPLTQRDRLCEVRGIPENRVDALLNSQMSMSEKVERASCVIWNDGNEKDLAAQLTLLNQLTEARIKA